MQNFINSLHVKESIKKSRRAFLRDEEIELKLLRAQVEFLNSANETRKNLGLSFQNNLRVTDLVRMTELEESNRIEEVFENGEQKIVRIYAKSKNKSNVDLNEKNHKRCGFINDSKTKKR